jgi:hypothetical protein
MTTSRVKWLGAATLALAAILVGCGDDDGFSPTVDTVAGTYAASVLTLTTLTGTVDLLAEGSEITVTLSTDGTTEGHAFIPEGGEDGGDFEEDLTGTWALDSTTVTFDHEADTFIRDVDFTASRGRLSGEITGGDQTLRLVLVRTGDAP